MKRLIVFALVLVIVMIGFYLFAPRNPIPNCYVPAWQNNNMLDGYVEDKYSNKLAFKIRYGDGEFCDVKVTQEQYLYTNIGDPVHLEY